MEKQNRSESRSLRVGRGLEGETEHCDQAEVAVKFYGVSGVGKCVPAFGFRWFDGRPHYGIDEIVGLLKGSRLKWSTFLPAGRHNTGDRDRSVNVLGIDLRHRSIAVKINKSPVVDDRGREDHEAKNATKHSIEAVTKITTLCGYL